MRYRYRRGYAPAAPVESSEYSCDQCSGQYERTPNECFFLRQTNSPSLSSTPDVHPVEANPERLGESYHPDNKENNHDDLQNNFHHSTRK